MILDTRGSLAMRLMPVLGLLLLLNSIAAWGDHHAKLPYSIVYGQLSVLHEIDHLDKISGRMLVRSRDENVRSADIMLSLNDGQQVHHFPIDEQGVVDFPLREDWRTADYRVESNQPAGTLKLDTGFGIKLLKARQLTYRLLMDCAEQIEQALALQAKITGQIAPRVVGLIFNFTPGEPSSISIAAGSGEQMYSSAGNHVIRLEMDEALLADNPIVSFEQLPINIQPWLDE